MSEQELTKGFVMTDFFQMICGAQSDIARELRVLAIEERSQTSVDFAEKTEEKIEKVKSRKRLCECAAQFLIEKPIEIRSGMIAVSDYPAIAQWLFHNKNKYPAAAGLAVDAWQKYLNLLIPDDFPAFRLVSLGAHFFQSPYQLAGFLAFLFNRGVPLDLVVNSGLLHQYVEEEYGVGLDDLKEMYQLLRLSEAQLVALSRTPVRVPILLNIPKSNHEGLSNRPFFSLNIMGETFEHETAFEKNTLNTVLNEFTLDADVIAHLDKLFQLFDWQLIKTLDFKSPLIDVALTVLLNAHFKKITDDLPRLALTGEISHELVMKILKHISKLLTPENEMRLQNLINQNPFYLLLYAHENQPLSNTALLTVEALKKIAESELYFDSRNLIYVGFICEMLNKINDDSKISGEIKRKLFESFLQNDELMDKSDFESVLGLNELIDFTREKIQHYRDELNANIEKWLSGEIDYYSVLIDWEGLQSRASSIFYIDPTLRQTTDYPKTGYELKAKLINSAWQRFKRDAGNDAEFDLNSLLETFCISSYENEKQKQKEKVRILQESLLFIREKECVDYLLQWIQSHGYNAKSMLEEPFGDGNSLIEKCVSNENTDLFLTLIPLINWNEYKIYRIFFYILTDKRFNYIPVLSDVINTREKLHVVLNELYSPIIKEDDKKNWTDSEASDLVARLLIIPNIATVLMDHFELFSTLVMVASLKSDKLVLDTIVKQFKLITTKNKFREYFREFERLLLPDDFKLCLYTLNKLHLYPEIRVVLDRECMRFWRKVAQLKSQSSRDTEDDSDDLLLLQSNIPSSASTSLVLPTTVTPMTSLTPTTVPPVATAAPMFSFPSSYSAPYILPAPLMRFGYEQFHKLSQNEYSRYARNSKMVSYLLEEAVSRQHNRTQILQYATTQFEKPAGFVGEGDPAPAVYSVSDCAAFHLPNGELGFQGFYNDVRLTSKRRYFLTISLPEKESTDYIFHPLSPTTRVPGFDASMPIREKFKDTVDAQALKTMPKITKESDDLIVHNADIPVRAEEKTRNPDQKTVMNNLSAMDLLNICLVKYRDYFSPDFLAHLERCAFVMHLQTLKSKDRKGEPVDPAVREAAFRDRFLRFELLHRHAHSLHPVSNDPQRQDNLGAASACFNTYMMVLERTVKYFSIWIAHSVNMINCKFDMFLDTELIEAIHFVVKISFNGVTIQLRQNIDTFVENPEYAKASDLAGLIGTISHLVNASQPISSATIPIYENTNAFFDSSRKRERLEREENANQYAA